jgi:hypothetical protein
MPGPALVAARSLLFQSALGVMLAGLLGRAAN